MKTGYCDSEKGLTRTDHFGIGYIGILMMALTFTFAGMGEYPVCHAQDNEMLQCTAAGHVLGFMPDSFYMASGSHALRVEFVGAQGVKPISDNAADVKNSKQALSLTKVTYPDLWKGITLVYEQTTGGAVKSTYTIAPGAKVGDIRLKYNVPVKVADNGSLQFAFETGILSESPPVAWQEIDGKKVPVSVGFRKVAEQEAGFAVGQYDPAVPLVIDPELQWNTFLGSSSGNDGGTAIATDGSGNIYITGRSYATWGSPVNGYSGGKDAFVAKLNINGVLQWNTFMGSSGDDMLYGIAVDNIGNIYVAGSSSATWGTPINAYGGGEWDGFVAKLNSDGVRLWNTFMGSPSEDYVNEITIGDSNNVYVTGYSNATWGSPINSFVGGEDVFVAKLNSNGVRQWNTFMGSSVSDEAQDIVADGSGNIYVTGNSAGTWGTPINVFVGGKDIFVVKLNSNGIRQWNTFMGASEDDLGHSITVDGSINIYVTGVSSNTWGTPINAYSGGQDAFVVKLNSSGIRQWNTFIGSSGYDIGGSISIDGSSNIYVTGGSSATWDSPINAYSGGFDAFVTKLNSSGVRQWNTFMGSSIDDLGSGTTVEGISNVYVIGGSGAKWGTPINAYSGGQDAFVAKITDTANATPNVTTNTTVTDITSTTAICGGNVTSDGGTSVTAKGVCWNTTGNPTISDSKTADGSGTGTFTSQMSGLTAYTTYYVRAYATNAVGTAYGSQVTFKTAGFVPTVTTSSPLTDITATSAICGGNVSSDGGVFVTATGVCWNTTGNPTISDTKTIDDSGTGTFTSQMSGLNADTTYYVKAYATNAVGTAYGDQITFTTLPIPVIEQGVSVSAIMDEDGFPLAWTPPTIAASYKGSDPMTWSISTPPAYGKAVISGTGTSPSTFTYSPDPDFSGYDSFTARVSSINGWAEIAVSVTINPINDSPAAVNDEYSIGEDRALNIPTTSGVIANDSDIDSNVLTAVLTKPPSNGTLTLNPDGSFVYMPKADFNGTDSFSYKAYDGFLYSDEVSAAITITPVNDAPILKSAGYYTLLPIYIDNRNSLGNSVSEIITDNTITDIDGLPVKAMAVVGVDNTYGNWQYSSDNGVSWKDFSSVVGKKADISNNAILLDGSLIGAASNRIRFVPNFGWTGSTNFTFRAWDKSSGTTGSMTDASSGGGETPFSASIGKASIEVIPYPLPAVNAVSISVLPPKAGGVRAEYLTCMDNCSEYFLTGIEIRLFAEALKGYRFDHWEKDVKGKVSPGYLMVDADKYVTAVFSSCPDDPNKMSAGICGCGIPDTDTDGDGIADCKDNCPSDPKKTEPGICGCGIPDTDTDGDGTADCKDNCLSDPKKTEPGACGCGIPDTDTDGDGIADCKDNCPSDPKKTEAGACGCGISDTPNCGKTAEMPQMIIPNEKIVVSPGSVKLAITPYQKTSVLTHLITQEYDKPESEIHHTSEGNILSEIKAGVKYLWKTGYETVDGKVLWYPEHSFIMETWETNRLRIEAGVRQADFKPVSMPLWQEDPSLRKIMGDSDREKFRIAAYDTKSGNYAEYGSDTFEARPGRAFWFFAKNGSDITYIGVPISINADVESGLDYNSETGNGWNMIASPNNSDYLWEDVEIVVYDGETVVFGPTAIGKMTFPNSFIDNRLWRWENGEYMSDTALIEKNQGYWVKAKSPGVYLRFTVRTQINASDKKVGKTRNSVTESDVKPPMPISDFSPTSDSGVNDPRTAMNYDSATGNGWNTVVSPDGASYSWEDIEVIVYEGATVIFGPAAIGKMTFPNNYIDNRLWRWENGDYLSDSALIEKNHDYRVLVKRPGVYLKFPVRAQISAGSTDISKTRKIIAESDVKPPMPNSDSGADTDSSGGGCFINSLF